MSKKNEIQYDKNGFEITNTHEEQDGPPILLRALLAVATVAIFWTLASNITNEHYLFANVSGSSMDYSLLDGQHVMIDTQSEPSLDRGSIVAFNANREDPLNPRIAKATENGQAISYVKRVVALPGETIEGREDGIYVNGEKLDEPYLANKYQPIAVPWTLESLTEGQLWADEKHHTVVPDDHVFILGDNREISEDSRYFGFVHKDSIIGEVTTLPWNDGLTIDREGQ